MTTKHPRDMSREEFARAIQAPWVGTDFAVARASQALEELVRQKSRRRQFQD